jgi:hypothetical protein
VSGRLEALSLPLAHGAAVVVGNSGDGGDGGDGGRRVVAAVAVSGVLVWDRRYFFRTAAGIIVFVGHGGCCCCCGERPRAFCTACYGTWRQGVSRGRLG